MIRPRVEDARPVRERAGIGFRHDEVIRSGRGSGVAVCIDDGFAPCSRHQVGLDLGRIPDESQHGGPQRSAKPVAPATAPDVAEPAKLAANRLEMFD